MAKPDTSIDPRIMDSAKEEFRTLGFERASLKSICQRAGVTTGALYKRYAGKEELFRAVVADTVADLDAVYEERTAVPASALSDEDLIRAWYMDEEYMLWWFRFLNERRDGFVLLLTGAEGTAYANFQHDWVEKMTEGTWTYYAEARRRGNGTVHGPLQPSLCGGAGSVSSLRLSYFGKPPAPSPEQAGKAAPGRDPGEGRWSLEEDVH